MSYIDRQGREICIGDIVRSKTCEVIIPEKLISNARGGKREGTGAKPRNTTKSFNRTIRMTDTEWQTIKQLAKLNDQTASDYIRTKALELKGDNKTCKI